MTNSYRTLVALECLALARKAINAHVSGHFQILGRSIGKTEDWMCSAISLSGKPKYQAPARLKGAAKDKRAAKKARNKKRGRK